MDLNIWANFHATFISNILNHLIRIPDEKDVTLGSLQQGEFCIDTLGHSNGEVVGMFSCHFSGGNQVGLISLKKYSHSH